MDVKWARAAPRDITTWMGMDSLIGCRKKEEEMTNSDDVL